MMIRTPIAMFALLFVVVACEPGTVENDTRVPEAAPVQASEPDTAGAASAAHSFHRALSAADSAAVLELLHPDALIYEAGHAETVEEYRAGHLAADIEFAAAVRREVVREETVAIGDAVLHLSETRAQGVFRDREIDSSGVGTMILVRQADDWRIRHIHWSSR